MSKAPKRPAGIAAKAWWDATDDEWVFGPLVDGKKQGDFTYWRAAALHDVVRGAGWRDIDITVQPGTKNNESWLEVSAVRA